MRRSPRLNKTSNETLVSFENPKKMAILLKPKPDCSIETVRIETNNPPSTEAEVDACILKAIHFHKGKKLGNGDNAEAFRISEDPSHVIKVAKLSSKRVLELWRNEACVGKALGDLGIAPKIEKVFECGKYGYIVMDFLHDAKKLVDGTVIREKHVEEDGEYAIDHVNLMPPDLQWSFIKDLMIMIDNGYIHMDNHVENLGFLGESRKPILFDFGFTQLRALKSESDKLWALCFSIFQILEHTPESELQCGPFWDVATAILRNDGKTKWSSLKSSKGMTLAELAKIFNRSKKVALSSIKKAAEAMSPENADIIVGSMCYGFAIQEPLETRHNDAYLQTVYKIRQGKKF
jgi:hypothetical protein